MSLAWGSEMAFMALLDASWLLMIAMLNQESIEILHKAGGDNSLKKQLAWCCYIYVMKESDLIVSRSASQFRQS